MTVSFTVPQAVEAGAAIERGPGAASGREQGDRVDGPGRHDHGRAPGRLAQDRRRRATASTIEPEHLEWGGVAAFKKAYEVFLERGFQARLLAAAYRNQLQWTELVGGDIVLSPPFGWQEKFQASGHDPVARIDEPVDPAIVDALLTIPDFVRAYEVDGMTHAEFDDFGATRTTLRQFLEADEALDQIVRDVIVPAP